jgi:tRNA(fMet)-specific endonuclease VapC
MTSQRQSHRGSIVLDTNVAVAALNENEQAIEWLCSYSDLLLPVIVLAELRFGALKSVKVDYNLSRINHLRDACTIIDVDEASAVIQAELRFQLHREGRPVGRNDLWIAGICLSRQLPLATFDADFARIPQLQILHW